jgi:hypothetical protein
VSSDVAGSEKTKKREAILHQAHQANRTGSAGSATPFWPISYTRFVNTRRKVDYWLTDKMRSRDHHCLCNARWHGPEHLQGHHHEGVAINFVTRDVTTSGCCMTSREVLQRDRQLPANVF